MAVGLADFAITVIAPIAIILMNMAYSAATRRSARQAVMASRDGWYQLKMAPALRVTIILTGLAGLFFVATLFFAPSLTIADGWAFGALALVFLLSALILNRRHFGFDQQQIRCRSLLSEHEIDWGDVERLVTDAVSGAQLVTGAKSYAIGNHWVGFSAFIAEAERQGVKIAPALRSTSS